MVEKTAGGYEVKLLPSSLGVFFDYCSLFQKDPKLFDGAELPETKPKGKERDAFNAALKAKTASYGGNAYENSRSDAEATTFRAALSNMEVWYAHASTTVILLTETRMGSCALPYLERGWPTFERSVSMLIKPGVGPMEWPTLIDVSLRRSACNRFAPLTPDGLLTLLMEKSFTNGADLEVVVKLYALVAERCIYPSKDLDCYGMSFGDEEMKVLCEWMQRCASVEELLLQRNAFTAQGWDLLAEIVVQKGTMPKLKMINVDGNKSEPSDKLREACKKRGITLIHALTAEESSAVFGA